MYSYCNANLDTIRLPNLYAYSHGYQYQHAYQRTDQHAYEHTYQYPARSGIA